MTTMIFAYKDKDDLEKTGTMVALQSTDPAGGNVWKARILWVSEETFPLAADPEVDLCSIEVENLGLLTPGWVRAQARESIARESNLPVVRFIE